MSRPVISVENLSKAYRIGLKEEIPDTLAGAFTGFLKSPFRNLRQLSRLDTFRHQADDEDIFWALKDVSFEVQEGEVLGVIGRNGAGKSTLLKILSRITEPTSGRAVIRGRVSSLLEVGTGFHPELSGRENVYLNGTILGMTKAEIDRKFDEIVDFSGVEKFLDTPIKRYSSGMKVRLAFAVAAHLEPEILIIDEVLAVGDAEFQKKCLGKMQDVASHGRTVLFVSHNMAAVEGLCDKGILLHRGKMEIDGAAHTVVSSYLTFVQREQASYRISTLNGDDGRGDEYQLQVEYPNRILHVYCGDEVHIDFVVTSPRTLRSLSAGLTIYTLSEQPIAGMSSKVQMVPSTPGSSKHWEVSVNLGRLPLNAGTYSIRVYLGDSHGDIARFTDAIQLNVEPRDVFGWGGALPSSADWGHLYWAPEWKFRPTSA